VVLNGGGAANPIFVVLDTPNDNGITTSGTGGNWVSEGEFNKLRWSIGSSTGNYSIPFTTGNDVKIPYQLAITTAGATGNHIDFSTYPTNPENISMPSMVNNLADAGTGNPDFSYVFYFFYLIINYQYLKQIKKV
jgi:hypothetical protein